MGKTKPPYEIFRCWKYRSHFGSRYLNRADAVTQAFFECGFVVLSKGWRIVLSFNVLRERLDHINLLAPKDHAQKAVSFVILAEGAIALSVTLSGGALFAS